MTYSEVQEVSGSVGNFKVKILKSPLTWTRVVQICDDCAGGLPGGDLERT